MKNKLAMKSIAYIAALAMMVTSVSITPKQAVHAKTYETNETIKPDGEDRTVYHDLDKITNRTWTFDSSDPKAMSKIEWDKNHAGGARLLIQNIDLSVTNTDVKSYLSYFSYSGNDDINVVLKGTNSLELNGNVCFIQSTGTADINIKSETQNPSGMYVTMNPAVDSTDKNECHFMEVFGNCRIGDVSGHKTTLSVETTGTSIIAYTNIYVGGSLDIQNANVSSTILATSSYMSANAIAVKGNLSADAKSMIVAKCNVADTNTPYRTVNNAVLVDGNYNDAGARVYFTNVNGHPLSVAGNITVTGAAPKAAPVIIKDTEGKVTGVKAKFGSTEIENNLRKMGSLPYSNFWFYSDAAYVTDSSNFLSTSEDKDEKPTVISLNYQSDEKKGDFFTHANVAPDAVPDTAKTIMSNSTMCLIASASDATAGVSYDNGDVIVSIKDETATPESAKANNILMIDGKAINIDEWGDAIRVSNEYVAVKLEGGTVTMREPGVYYYVFSNEFCQYIGPGEHELEIITPSGIIATKIILADSSSPDGDKVNSSDSYGKIISITKNKDGDTIYTYDTGTIRAVSYDKDGKASTTTISYSNGDTMVKHPDGTSTLTQANGSVTIYDKNGNVVSITNKPGEDKPTPPPVDIDAAGLDLAISGISEGFTHEAVSDSVLKAAQSAVEAATPEGKTASLIALSDIKPKSGTEMVDGAYQVKFDIASISASDDIMILHKPDSGSWEAITPDVIGNKYVTAKFFSFSPVAFVKLTENKPSEPEPSDKAKEWNENISEITDGFANRPVANDSIITAAQTAINDAKGTSEDTWTMRALSVIAKNAGTADGKVSMKVKDIKDGDIVKVLARQSDSSWKEIESAVKDGRVEFNSGELGDGTVAIVEVKKSETKAVISASDVDLSQNNAEIVIRVSGIDATFLNVLSVDGKTVPFESYYLKDSHIFIRNAYAKTLSNGSHTVKADFNDGQSAESIFSVTGNNAADNTPAPTPGNTDNPTPTPTSEPGGNDPTQTPGNSQTPAPTPDGSQTPEPTPTNTPDTDPGADIPALKAWDAAITAVASGYTKAPVTSNVFDSASVELNSIACGGNGTYSIVAMTRLTKSGDAENAVLTVPAVKIDESIQYIILALDDGGVWQDISAKSDIKEGIVSIPSSDVGNEKNIAIIKHIHRGAGNDNPSTPSPSPSSDPDNGNNGGNNNGGNNGTAPTADPNNGGGNGSNGNTGNNANNTPTAQPSTKPQTPNNKTSDKTNKDSNESSTTTSTNGDSSNSSSQSDSDGTNESSSSGNSTKKQAKSARTGQDPWEMFVTYFLNGISW